MSFNHACVYFGIDSRVTGDFKSVVLKSRRESAHARTFGGDFELKFLRMRGFSSRFWTMDLKSPVQDWKHASGAFRVRVNTGSESSSARAIWREIQDLHLSMATGLPAVNDVEPFSPGTG